MTEGSVRRPEPAGALWVALGFIALAIVLRLPAMLYSVLNFDESMYLLMGDKLRQGFLPYTALCDLKPVGLFGLFALISALPMDGVLAMRLCAAVAVGLSAFLLWMVAPRLFDDPHRHIGTMAGLSYVVFMLANGGLNAQAELFMNLASLLGLLLALRATGTGGRPRLGLMVAAGLVLGVGVQIKQVVAIDMLAYLFGFFLLTTQGLRQLPARIREAWLPLAALGLAATVPTLVIMLVYAVSGNWDAWVAGNLTTHRGFYGDTGPEIAWDAGFRALVEQAPLWVAALVVLVVGGRLARDLGERRAILFLWLWIVLVGIGQLFLRFMSDHYFLQFLMPLGLLTGFLLGRGVLERLDGGFGRRAVLAALVVLGVFAAAKNPIVNAVYIARDRYVGGEAHAGDAARQAATEIAKDLRPGDALYVVGFMPIVYYLTGAEIPTRFAFTGLPNQRFPGRDGCTWVEPRVELQRILDSNPRFILVEQGVFFEELPPELKRPLLDRLGERYRLRAEFEQHPIHHLYPFERFVMNGAAAARLYERVDPVLSPEEVAS
ncbi:glycosyltransferase family 39 protein [Geminicoccus harenae]|uniref:glycosyltransferase family 39 protein n=1 Tax=Geminicoccus harenae TaxID=2498453 RepID=UPI001C96C553|nr:glycosyltransferase family 39 protein [Geminicoccus harenae]